MKCVIIAGGKGTRLGLSNLPKPMALVGGVPVIEHQVRLACRYGYREIIVLAGYLSQVIVRYLGDGSRFGVRIDYLVENQPLGTGGALRTLAGRISNDFLVFNGDVFVDMNLRALETFHRSAPADGTLVVHPNGHPYDSDLVEMDAERRIRAFHPKPRSGERDYRNLVNAGLYVLSPAVLELIPSDRPSDLGRDVFPALLASGRVLRAYSTPEYLKDMGTPDRLASVDADYRAGKPGRRNLEMPQKCIFLDRDGVINTETGGVLRPDSFHLTPEIVPALRRINAGDFLAVVVTNQPFIAKGQLTEEGLEAIHARMDSLLGAEGVYVDALYYCPHHPERGWPGEVPELKIDCSCRKPKPGMILRAAEELHIDLSVSCIIGDHVRDVRAGKKAGLRASFLIGPGDTVGPEAPEYDARFASVDEAVLAFIEEFA
jgi:mannose-1-phosphate guanylyltransferase / phosphomannomutase